MAKERSVVGDLINFRGLVYSPINEQGVVYLFSKVAEDLNMYVEEVKTAYPDCIARRFNGKGWEKIYIEFEYLSSNFQQHGHDPEECDLIVCWEHDWLQCPIEVLELKSVIKGLPNKQIIRPDQGSEGQEEVVSKKKEFFERLGIPKFIQDLYEKIEPQLLALGDGVWRKIAPNDFSFYSPKRVFVFVRPQKSRLRLDMFTRGQNIENVIPIGYKSGGFKWGRMYIDKESEIPAAVGACHEAYKRILLALENNEPTGWYAEVEEADAETMDEMDEDNVNPAI